MRCLNVEPAMSRLMGRAAFQIGTMREEKNCSTIIIYKGKLILKKVGSHILSWFGSRFQLQKLHASTNSSIYIGGIEVKPVEYVRDLGVILDNQLSMRKHIC